MPQYAYSISRIATPASTSALLTARSMLPRRLLDPDAKMIRAAREPAPEGHAVFISDQCGGFRSAAVDAQEVLH